MLLAIDIGNTNINIAIFSKKGKIRKRYSQATKELKLLPIIKTIAKKESIDKIIMVSVVPKRTLSVKRILKRYFKGIRIYILGKNITVPIKCAYKKNEVGQDRLATAFAAKILYGLPILIVDFGTAVTFDAVSEKNIYIGGLIVPGIKMSLDSLYERAAMLPRTYLKATRSFIGKNTTSSIRNGLIYGYSSLCEGIINMFKKHVEKKIKIVATGGDAELIASYTKSIKKVDKDLTLKGLFFLSALS